MNRLLVAAAVAGGMWVGATAARAEDHCFRPHSTSVTWPSATPPGWYTNTYNYKWYYPWYSNYDYTSGPYANWMAGGGYATYANNGTAGMAYLNRQPAQPYLGVWYNPMQEQQSQPAVQGKSLPQPQPMPAQKKDGK